MKTEGLHSLIRMHLTQRGGHKSEKKILPEDFDGHVQNLRACISEADLKHKGKAKSTASPKACGGSRPTQIVSTPICAPVMDSTHDKSPRNLL